MVLGNQKGCCKTKHTNNHTGRSSRTDAEERPKTESGFHFERRYLLTSTNRNGDDEARKSSSRERAM